MVTPGSASSPEPRPSRAAAAASTAVLASAVLGGTSLWDPYTWFGAHGLAAGFVAALSVLACVLAVLELRDGVRAVVVAALVGGLVALGGAAVTWSLTERFYFGAG